MQNPTAYTFSSELVQAVINQLNQAPAYQTRALLNALEGECLKQDKVSKDKADADARDIICANFLAKSKNYG